MNADLVKDYGGVSWAIYEVMENGNYRLMYEGGRLDASNGSLPDRNS